MARKSIDKEIRQKINDSRKMIENVFKLDGNEAETRRRVERIFENLMGYNVFAHLSREHAIKGAGETEHVDFAIQLEPGVDAKPVIMIELKRVGVDLAKKHLKQVSSYAIDSGCEWVLLTNGREWKLHHVEFDQPPKTKLIEHWNLLTDDIAEIAGKFETISYKMIKRGSLKKLWEKATVLSPQNLLCSLVSEDCLKILRKILRKNSGVSIDTEDLVKGITKLLNESSAIELSKIKIDFSPKPRKPRKFTKKQPKEDSDL